MTVRNCKNMETEISRPPGWRREPLVKLHWISRVCLVPRELSSTCQCFYLVFTTNAYSTFEKILAHYVCCFWERPVDKEKIKKNTTWFSRTGLCKNSVTKKNRLEVFFQCHTVSVINLGNRTSWWTRRSRDIAKYCAKNRCAKNKTGFTWNVPGHRVIKWKLS